VVVVQRVGETEAEAWRWSRGGRSDEAADDDEGGSGSVEEGLRLLLGLVLGKRPSSPAPGGGSVMAWPFCKWVWDGV